ncbi:two-component system activity regulator YycH [Sporosarcina sp. GW1-11]|uniref:YycH family regulatory protein n=1 Tax=Sporosarcina sp. GW1-11 TaxID=2899126 RepID=UPI00294BDC9B|nr:two-component system activity regulator YycH [Sporosarcina sp. GW1-11]MDV6378803.1 two-component system activity regulator YycH [Sporosarcina sp. GW1-11]
MGLKYVETVKSIVLLLLVVLSIMFTFTVWNFSPNYEPMEQMQTVDISIAEKKTIDEIIKPYKIITNLKDQVLGSVEASKINTILSEMGNWEISDFHLINQKLSKLEIAQLLQRPSQMTLYFPGEVPILVYDNVLLMSDTNIPESTFNRLIIDWSQSTQLPTLHFVSEANGLHYQAQITLSNKSSFLRNVVDVGQSFNEYAEIDRGNAPLLAVPKDPVSTTRNTYYQEEINPRSFRDALFTDPNAVKRSQVDSSHEEYGDDHAFMSVNMKTKMLNYVMPAAESQEIAIPSELLLNTIDFINEHGGWTDEFRFTYMNPISRHVEFQLYVDGLPVYSDQSETNKITQKWGESRVFKYIRPYYTLDVNVEKVEEELPSGIDVAEALKNSDELNFDLIDEITVGYYLIHDENRNLLILQPCWYYLIKDNWFRFTPAQYSGGGEQFGLE